MPAEEDIYAVSAYLRVCIANKSLAFWNWHEVVIVVLFVAVESGIMGAISMNM